MTHENVKLYTSNFRNAGKHENAVGISRGVPPWFKGRRYLDLAPSRELLNRWKSMNGEQEFIEAYNDEVLSRLDPAKVVEELGDGAIMLCWEKPGEFCHRLIVAGWLKATLGIAIDEWTPEKKSPAAGRTPKGANGRTKPTTLEVVDEADGLLPF